MVSRKLLGLSLVVCTGASLIAPLGAFGQDDPTPRRGRKYKAPPVVSHVEVTVVRANNGKPIPNAAVIFHPMKDGKDEGNLEVKTDPDGKAVIDVIATGSDLRVQVIASGYATYGQDFKVETATKEIAISMVRPRAQVSAYTDNTDQPSQRKPGVQEPARPKSSKVPPAGSTAPATPPASPPPTTPSTPVDPTAGGSPPTL